jgi:hypothetical protein
MHLHLVRLATLPTKEGRRPAKVVQLEARRQARLERQRPERPDQPDRRPAA